MTKKIQKQVQRLGIADTTGEPQPAILNESVLVINQKGKLVELRAEYAIYNQNGLQLAAVRGKRMSSRIQVIDMNGRSLLDLRRWASILSSKVNVTGASGARLGRIVPSLNGTRLIAISNSREPTTSWSERSTPKTLSGTGISMTRRP